MRRSPKFRRIQCTIRKKPFLLKKGSGMTFLLARTETLFSAEVSKLVMRLVRRYDQDEREIDGAVRWNSMVPKLRAESISEVRRAKILGHGLASTHLSRKQQDEVPVETPQCFKSLECARNVFACCPFVVFPSSS